MVVRPRVSGGSCGPGRAACSVVPVRGSSEPGLGRVEPFCSVMRSHLLGWCTDCRARAAVGRRLSCGLPSTALRLVHARVRHHIAATVQALGTGGLPATHRTAPRTMLLYGRPRPRRLVVARHRWRAERTRSPSPGGIPGGNRVVLCPGAQAVGPAFAPTPPNVRPPPGARHTGRVSGVTAPAAGWSPEPRRHAPPAAHRVSP